MIINNTNNPEFDHDKPRPNPNSSIRRFLTDLPDTVKVGGKDYKIYPMTIGKIELTEDKFASIAPIIGYLEAIGFAQNKELADEWVKKIKDAIMDIVYIFHIITTPNGSIPPELTDERIKEIKYNLDIPTLLQILFILRTQAQFTDILKNVPTLKEKKENSPGEPLSVGSSNSPDGDSTI